MGAVGCGGAHHRGGSVTATPALSRNPGRHKAGVCRSLRERSPHPKGPMWGRHTPSPSPAVRLRHLDAEGRARRGSPPPKASCGSSEGVGKADRTGQEPPGPRAAAQCCPPWWEGTEHYQEPDHPGRASALPPSPRLSLWPRGRRTGLGSHQPAVGRVAAGRIGVTSGHGAPALPWAGQWPLGGSEHRPCSLISPSSGMSAVGRLPG